MRVYATVWDWNAIVWNSIAMVWDLNAMLNYSVSCKIYAKTDCILQTWYLNADNSRSKMEEEHVSWLYGSPPRKQLIKCGTKRKIILDNWYRQFDFNI